MLGDVGDPKPVRPVGSKAPFYEVRCGRHMWDSSGAPASTDAGAPSSAHQHFHGAMTNHQAVSERQLGVNATGAIGPMAVQVDSPDELGEESVPDRPRRW